MGMRYTSDMGYHPKVNVHKNRRWRESGQSGQILTVLGLLDHHKRSPSFSPFSHYFTVHQCLFVLDSFYDWDKMPEINLRKTVLLWLMFSETWMGLLGGSLSGWCQRLHAYQSRRICQKKLLGWSLWWAKRWRKRLTNICFRDTN